MNLLRNLAWAQSTTPFVFLIDVDFIPTNDTIQNLEHSLLVQQFVREDGILNGEKVALVIPAFRGSLRNITIQYKNDVLELLDQDLVYTFGFQLLKGTIL